MRVVPVLMVLVMMPGIASAQRRPAKSKPAAQQQRAADLNQPFPLAELVVTGNKNLPAEQVIALSGLKKGQTVTKSHFDAAQKRMLDTGLFERVDYRFEAIPGAQAYRATFEVKEIDQLFPYRFEALEGDPEAMRKFLYEREPLFRDRIPATEPVLKKMAGLLDEFMAKNGRPIHVVGRLMPDGSNRMEVVFQPSSLPAVAEVKFTGNKAIPQSALQQAIAGAGVGALYTENRFRQIIDANVRPLFEAEGRLRVAFPKLETSPATSVKGIVVNVHVAEGDTYKLRNVELSGSMAEDKALLKIGRFRTGDIANMTAVQEGVTNMERALKRRGYLKIDSKVERKIDDKEKVVDLVISIDPGPQYRMGTLVIEGLDIETEPHIRKMWALKPNQPFDSDYPDLFLSKMPEVLDSLGKTRSVVKPDPGTLKVDVTLHFEGEKKQPEKPKP